MIMINDDDDEDDDKLNPSNARINACQVNYNMQWTLPCPFSRLPAVLAGTHFAQKKNK